MNDERMTYDPATNVNANHMKVYHKPRARTSTTMTSSSLLLVILHHLRLCWNFLLSLINISPANSSSGGSGAIISLTNLFSKRQLLTFDNGTQVSIGDQIAEGGFSYVFEAFPVVSTTTSSSNSSLTQKKKYALKRINCSDHELLQSCRHEAGIHRSLPRHHPNLLELLGLKFEQDNNNNRRGGSISSSSLSGEYNVCYMLFPHVPTSLRGEITRRNILSNIATTSYSSNNSHARVTTSRRRPFTTAEALHLFRGILDGLLTMHNTNLSHRDVKLENVLLSQSTYTDHHRQSSSSSRTTSFTPILMDYGSAGPLQSTPLTTRNSIRQLVELAETHTTFSYRPPELSDVGNYLRASSSSSCVVDYGKVDVWSLGCVLFGILHGVSPFEMDFVRGTEVGHQQHQQFGMVRVVECTTLKILNEVPFPPWVGSGLGTNNDHVGDDDGSNGKYPLSLYNFIRYMVQHDRMTRPNLYEVRERFGQLHYELLGEEWIPYSDGRRGGGNGVVEDDRNDGDLDGEQDDFDSLITSRDFV